jgi:hypothetical protein
LGRKGFIFVLVNVVFEAWHGDDVSDIARVIFVTLGRRWAPIVNLNQALQLRKAQSRLWIETTRTSGWLRLAWVDIRKSIDEKVEDPVWKLQPYLVKPSDQIPSLDLAELLAVTLDELAPKRKEVLQLYVETSKALLDLELLLRVELSLRN